MPARRPAKPATVGGVPVATDPIKAEGDRPGFFARLSTVRKAVVAFLVGGLGWVATCYVPDGHVTRAEWYALAVVAVGVLGVHQIPNAQPGEVDAEAGMSLLEFIVAIVGLLVLLAIGLAIANNIH